MRTATRLRLMVPSQIEFAVIGDARLAGGAHHFADGHRLLAGAREGLRDRGGVLGRGDDDHADAAVEGAQHFRLRDAAFAAPAI